MHRSLAPSDPEYPRALLELPSPPALRVAGELPRGDAVAIVGARAASDASLTFAFDLARTLSHEGVVVWSGGALGVDAAAHEGALAGPTPTVVALGGGLLRPYPEEHADLFARVAQAGGALVSITEDDVPPKRHLFFARNAVLAAATRLVVLVECGVKSGARNAASHARSLGRPVLVVPHSPWSSGSGAVLELKLGGLPIGSIADVLRLLGREISARSPTREDAVDARRPADFAKSLSNDKTPGRPPRKARSRAKTEPVSQLALPPLLTPDEVEVVSAVRAGACHPDTICDRLGFRPERVASAVLELVLRGVLADTPMGLAPIDG